MRTPEQATETDVVVVGYGGAGAVAAISAHDAGAKVLILEKLPADTANEIRHTPTTLISHGGWFCPTDPQMAVTYMEALAKAANETVDDELKGMISTFAEYSARNNEWMESIGAKVVEPEFLPEFPDLPGSKCCFVYQAKPQGGNRFGAAFFGALVRAVQQRNIPVMWETPATHLILANGEVRGIRAMNNGGEISIMARRAIVLTTGGFEFNESMKQNYLKAYPAHFNGNPGNTGDGINMAIEAGADLWHMNAASWGLTIKFPDFPMAFDTQLHGEKQKATILVDKIGKRFSSEKLSLTMHAFGYELTNYDSALHCYTRVPCYAIFDEQRRNFAPLGGQGSADNIPGKIMRGVEYRWDTHNQKEIERGWVMKGDTLEELAGKILADPDNNGLMRAEVLRETVKKYNGYCRQGEDVEFHKPKELLQALESPPYYALKVWPGGINTQGGPRRNTKGQVIRADRSPVPRLYSAGELGSVWGMLYQLGGNLAECIAFGRIAGTNAETEKPWH